MLTAIGTVGSGRLRSRRSDERKRRRWPPIGLNFHGIHLTDSPEVSAG